MTKKLLCAAMAFTASFAFSQSLFKEDFNDLTVISRWENIDRDGDGEKWEYYNAEAEEINAFTGNFATSWSWFLKAFTPDNALVSPPFAIPQNQEKTWLKFKVAAFDEESFEEHYAVYIIPALATFTGTETPVFEETLDQGYSNGAKTVSVDISAHMGQDVQIVFRHYNSTDMLYVGIDDIEVYQDQPSLGTAQTENLDFRIFPNPATDFLRIQNAPKLEQVRVFDLNGRRVLQTTESEIDVRNLAPGIYIVNVYSGNEVISKKFIKK